MTQEVLNIIPDNYYTNDTQLYIFLSKNSSAPINVLRALVINNKVISNKTEFFTLNFFNKSDFCNLSLAVDDGEI